MSSGGREVARVSDIWVGTCYACSGNPQVSGIVITGSPDVLTNDRQTARVGDIVVGNCGHTGIIITGCNTVFANDREVAALTDLVGGNVNGIIVTGSTDVVED